MKRFKINFAVAAILAGSLIALTQSAFTPATVKHARFGTEYQFNGTTTAQQRDATNYSVVSGDGPVCDDSDIHVCTINVTGDLQTWLTNHSDADILGAADQTKD